MTPSAYLRHKATLLRARLQDQSRMLESDEREGLLQAARQFEIAADEIAAGFHESE